MILNKQANLFLLLIPVLGPPGGRCWGRGGAQLTSRIRGPGSCPVLEGGMTSWPGCGAETGPNAPRRLPTLWLLAFNSLTFSRPLEPSRS